MQIVIVIISGNSTLSVDNEVGHVLNRSLAQNNRFSFTRDNGSNHRVHLGFSFNR